MFQYFKFYIFDIYFKKWDKVLYIDSGMHIYNPIKRLFDISTEDVLYAHSDSYPEYTQKLDSQFAKNNSIYDNLQNEYDLTINNYFQSTMLYFDTHIIKENMVKELIDLLNTYPISNGDQAIMNLYFIDTWKPMPIKDSTGFFYDFMERENYKPTDYIMLKYPK